MGDLSARKMEIVRTLVQTAPDRVVGSLSAALNGTSDDSPLGGVRRLVEAEILERNVRFLVLRPIAPMCVGRGDDPSRLTFPSMALGLIWKALKEGAADLVEQARETEHDVPSFDAVEAFDALCAVAATGLRARFSREFRSAAELCDQRRPDGAEQLARCLDIASVVRKAASKLPDWLSHPGSETAAAARLAFKDAVAVDEDATPRFFEMLAAQLPQPWMILRIISAVMDKPTERYLADSELAAFGEHVLDSIDASLGKIHALGPGDGPDKAVAAARMAELVVQQIHELDTSVDLNRAHGWGARLQEQRRALAGIIEKRLKDVEKLVREVFPLQAQRGNRAMRPAPQLTRMPDEALVSRAITLLTFSDELHGAANYGGFSAVRSKMIEAVGEYLDSYVDDLLDRIRTHEVTDTMTAQAYLDTAAEIVERLRGEASADLVRRRSHAALLPDAATG